MAKDYNVNKGSEVKNTQYECNPMSIKHVGKALGSSTDTVNPFSIRKNSTKVS